MYGLGVDSGEVHDQVGAQPEIMARLVQYWETCYTETGMIDLSHVFPHVSSEEDAEDYNDRSGRTTA